MNLFLNWLDVSLGLREVSIGLVLIVKLTIVLALAWVAHGMLMRRNPRWRIALWRSTVVGLAVMPVFSACPPIVTYQHVTGERKSAVTRPTDSHSEIARSTEISAARAVRPAPALVPVRERIDAIRPCAESCSLGRHRQRERSGSCEVPGIPLGCSNRPVDVVNLVGRRPLIRKAGLFWKTASPDRRSSRSRPKGLRL